MTMTAILIKTGIGLAVAVFNIGLVTIGGK